jgi:glycosyltransferase involved in cell wall biosynthesis
VTATPLAASSRFRPVGDSAELERVRKKYGINGDYILTVGSIQPRKNMPRLIRAYAHLCREAKLESIPKLIVAGKRAWLFDDTLDAAENSAVRDQILFVGYVPEEDLSGAVHGSEVFCLSIVLRRFWYSDAGSDALRNADDYK